MIARFLKDGTIYAFAGFLTRGISFLLLPLYTRIFSPTQYGALDLIFTFGTLIHLTVALEISQGLARYYGSATDATLKKSYASSALWFTVLAYSVFFIFGFLYSQKLSLLVIGKMGYTDIFQLALVSFWFVGIFNLLQNQFRWGLRSRDYAISSILVAILTAILSILLAYYLDLGLVGVLSALCIANMIGCCFAIPRLRSVLGCEVNFQHLKQMLLFSLPLVPSGIAVFIAYYIDRIMIRHFLSLEDVGIYSIAFRVATISGLIVVGFQNALTPLILSHHEDEKTPHHIATIFRYFVTFSLLLFLGLSIFSHEILVIMTTPAYYKAASVIPFLVPAILLSNMYIFAPGTTLRNKTHIIMWINIAGAVLNIALNYTLIPLFGIIGACLSTLINYTCVFAAYIYLGQKLYFIPYPWKTLSFGLLATIILITISTWIQLSFLAAVICKIILGLVAIPCFIFLKLITIDEIYSIKNLITHKLFRQSKSS